MMKNINRFWMANKRRIGSCTMLLAFTVALYSLPYVKYFL